MMMTLFTILILLLFPILFFLMKRSSNPPRSRVPPGSLGLPIIGQSLTLLRRMKANTAEEWLLERTRKYGPISKLSLFGRPTVFMHGQAANKFVFSNGSSMLGHNQTESVKRILGSRNLLELSGQDHKRVREALGMFLRPECLKQYVGKMDEEVRLHIEKHWQGKEEVKVLPLMKTLTFNIICSLLFGIERGQRRDKLGNWFQDTIQGMWSIPINLPFTSFNRSLKSSAKAGELLKELMAEKRKSLVRKDVNPNDDLLTSMLNRGMDDAEQPLTDEEIVDNAKIVMVAGYDTSSIVLTFFLRLLANEPDVHAAVLREQENIAKIKPRGELLTWEDLAKMKYTWRVVQETMRMYPPIFGGFRRVLKPIEYEGYLIPEGWQIFWSASMTHMDETLFPKPSEVDPSRFENPASVPPYCFIPFGGGLRICPGNDFARIEILVTIHYLVTQFTWKLSADDSFSRDPMPTPNKGLPIKLMERKQM